jgi:UDP-N-acetylmuramoyl-L-alanyl-D-glutamate--2,6-diaminopimelate ligase
MSFRSLVKAFIPKKLFRNIEPYGHLSEAVLLNLLNGFPARKLKVIGVTGTNGKTTTCFLIHKMMHEAGYKVGLMTTVAYGVGDNLNPQVHHMTNVAVPELMQRLKWFEKQGVDWLVLETTSHALAQNRVWGIPYSLAVMTNVTHEHLDYHGSFESYLEAKLKLFELTAKNKKGLKMGVVNADDACADRFTKAVPESTTYGTKQGQIKAKDIKATSSGSQFRVVSSEDKNLKLDIKVNLPGSFNIYNALAAVSTGLTLGIDPVDIEKGIAALTNVEGRMTNIDEGQPFSVVVDFAHTPDSF